MKAVRIVLYMLLHVLVVISVVFIAHLSVSGGAETKATSFVVFTVLTLYLLIYGIPLLIILILVEYLSRGFVFFSIATTVVGYLIRTNYGDTYQIHLMLIVASSIVSIIYFYEKGVAGDRTELCM